MPTPASLFGAIVFGAIGLAAFVHGKRRQAPIPMLVGVALMLYPYFIEDTAAVFLIGAALTSLLYFFRE